MRLMSAWLSPSATAGSPTADPVRPLGPDAPRRRRGRRTASGFAGLSAGDPIEDGWGEVSYWPATKVWNAGDWTPAIWRSPELAEASLAMYDGMTEGSASHPKEQLAGRVRTRDRPDCCDKKLFRSLPAVGTLGSFPIHEARRAADAQTSIQSTPDAEHWHSQNKDMRKYVIAQWWYLPRSGDKLLDESREPADYGRPGQHPPRRLSCNRRRRAATFGNGWMPVTGIDAQTKQKAAAVFINSTAGRLQLLRHPGRKIPFPAIQRGGGQ